MERILNLSDFLSSELIQKPFCLVLGRPIVQSLSPDIHNAAFRKLGIQWTYHKVLVEAHEETLIPSLFDQQEFKGANITIPLKSKVVDYLDSVTGNVMATGACNTVYRNERGFLCGDNTDIEGFLEPLEPYRSNLSGTDALLFGTGGAARAAAFALKSIGMKSISYISRSGNGENNILGYHQWESMLDKVTLLVNCTPVGMYPATENSVLSDGQTASLSDKICYDMIYRPLTTRFLFQASKAGAITVNGLGMFVGQATRSFFHFTGQDFPREVAYNVLHQKLESTAL